MALSASLREYWWIYTIMALGLAICFKVFKESEPGQALTDWLYVEAPLLARLSNKIYTCELLRTLGNLMESQVPLLEALEVTRSTIRNRFFRHFVDEIMEHVQQGGKFSQPFSTYPYILPSVKQMVATGEEVGNLPQVMLRLATFYDAEVDRELKAFSAMIEPLALIVMGAVVGLIVASVILPIFKLGHALH
jgi:type II secretory pathway component PulF